MLELFVIFSKSGIVLFATEHQSLNQIINGLIRHAFLDERPEQYHTEQLELKFHRDNEFELMFVVAYQKALKLRYVDKFLDDIQLAFRDKYSDFDLAKILTGKNLEQTSKLEFLNLFVDDEASVLNFTYEFGSIYRDCVKNSVSVPKQESMRTFQDSAKSKKTIASLVVQKTAEPPKQSAKKTVKKGKAARQWELSGSNSDEFDFSKKSDQPVSQRIVLDSISPENMETNLQIANTPESDETTYFESLWKTISCDKTLSRDDLKPVLAHLQEHLTSKNVAADIAEKLCENIKDNLEKQHVRTWTNLKKIASDALEESILRLLKPSRNINILREIQAKERPPYVMAFCGVNGVGKSTNLAKISNWLISNGMKVLVVACDTFRAGAIEQLKTHVMALKSIHERGKNAELKIELFERGYGRDSAAIAMEAINYARLRDFHVVMVDTAGRMQDNEPLMKQLAKLIKVNTPDLTLFVGEALVGNEAVDQLTRFNNSLIENGCQSAINGIVLTKFDTIDDQVGAAISMTYVTGQPIVFVGVGQTYRDLKQLDAKAVTRALMR